MTMEMTRSVINIHEFKRKSEVESRKSEVEIFTELPPKGSSHFINCPSQNKLITSKTNSGNVFSSPLPRLVARCSQTNCKLEVTQRAGICSVQFAFIIQLHK